MDLLLVNPGATRERVYQDLSKEITAIEPPFWAALTAGFIRKHGYTVDILDANALNLSIEETAKKIIRLNPCLVNIVVYGQQPAASTQLMDSVTSLCEAIKERDCEQKIILTGLHPSALPIKTMMQVNCDYVGIGEGFYTLLDLMQPPIVDLSKVRGLAYRLGEFCTGETIVSTGRTDNIQDLTKELPDIAWDLLPKDKYRAHNWHCLGGLRRDHYVSLSTSLGCPFTCSFCSIHATFGEHRIRYWSPEWVLRQIDILVNNYNIKNLKIIDELFIFNPKHFIPICDGLIERDYDLNIWAYARVDTVKEKYLKKLRKAGFRWLALGIEAGKQEVRTGVSKGRFEVEDIRSIVRKIKDADINIMGNYIFALPDDDYESMQQTLDLAMELNCEFANLYCCMGYPGSELYYNAKREDLPENWSGYSQHSYDCQPLPTKTLSAADVLFFRDNAFHKYFTNERYLQLIEHKFGEESRRQIEEMTKVTLKRRLYKS